MTVEQRIDDLIEAGWRVLNSNFDAAEFAIWRRKALDCVTALVGPSHTYARYFSDFVEEAESKSVLAGEGILIAAKEQLATTGFALRDRK
jgi:hypothetical protein